MDINLKNYNDSIINGYEVFKEKSNLIFYSNYLNINLPYLIEYLKEEEKLSPTKNFKISIIFENFNSFTDFLYNLKKFTYKILNKLNLTSTYPEQTSYLQNTNEIHIINDIYNQEHIFSKYLRERLTNEEFINYIVLHELGHAIQTYLKNEKGLNFSLNQENHIVNFLNNSIPFIDINYLDLEDKPRLIEKELNLMVSNKLKEGFAELYACISVYLIYPQEQALNIIKTIKSGRDYADLWGFEYYHNQDMIEILINDIENNKLPNFNNFNEILLYMEDKIAKSIINKLEEEINNKRDNDIFVNHYLGTIYNILKPENCTTLKETIDYINNKYNLSFCHRKENEYFEYAKKLAFTNSPNPKLEIITPEQLNSKIMLFRKKFAQEENLHDKPKI